MGRRPEIQRILLLWGGALGEAEECLDAALMVLLAELPDTSSKRHLGETSTEGGLGS